MAGSPELSPRAAVVVGLMLSGMGVALILGALGMIHLPPSPGVPVWIGVAAGLTFVLGGAAVVISYANAGVDPDVQYILAVAIYGLFAAIAGWIAFGNGPRAFSTTGSLALLTRHGAGGEWTGRAFFGLGAVLAAAGGIATAWKGFRKLRP